MHRPRFQPGDFCLSTANGGLKPIAERPDADETHPFYRQWRTETLMRVWLYSLPKFFLPPMAD